MADRYWVGGTGNWDASSTTHWSATSGGAGGASVPTSSDNVIFDANSNPSGYTCTITATGNCLDFIHGAPAAGSGTFAGTSALNVYGSYSLSLNSVMNHTGLTTFRATSTGKTISTGGPTGKNVNSNWTFDGVGGGWTMMGGFNHAYTPTRTWTLTNGSLDTNGFTVRLEKFLSTGTATRSLTLGASVINISGTALLPRWNINATGMTLSAASSTINMVFTSSTSSNGFQGGDGLTYGDINLSVSQLPGGHDCRGNFTCTNLTLGGVYSYQVDSPTITGTLTIVGNAAFGCGLFGNTYGVASTVTAAAVSLTNADFRDITAAGAAAPFTGTRMGDCGGNTNITTDAPRTIYWVAFSGGQWTATTSWSTTSGGASGAPVPLPQDTGRVDANSITSGGRTITIGVIRTGTVDCTGVLNNPTIDATGAFYGNWIMETGITGPDANQLEFNRRGGTLVYTSKEVRNTTLSFNAIGATLQLTGSLLSDGSINVNYGTFEIGAENVECDSFDGSGSEVRTIKLGSGTWTIGNGVNFSSNSPWLMTTTTNLTFDAQTSTIKILNTGTAQATFAGGGLTYNNFWYHPTVEEDLLIVGSNTFNEFKDDGAVAHSLRFTTGTTQHVTTFNVVGTPGELITINSTTTGTHALIKDGGGNVDCDYLDIQHSVATPGLTWYAGLNSVNDQGVATAGSGWIFTEPVSDSAGFFALMGG